MGQTYGFGPENFISKIGQKWPKNGHKTFSRLKKDKNVVFGPENIFSQISQKMAKRPFLGQKMAKICLFWIKKVKNAVFGPEKNFSQIGRKRAKKWPKDVF